MGTQTFPATGFTGLKRVVAIFLLAISTSSSSITHAATFTYNRATSNTSATADQWSAATNWNATPVSASDTTLMFGSSAIQLGAGATIFTNDDISADFKLNFLNFAYGSTGLSPKPLVTISGNRLEFVSNGASTPFMNVSAGGLGVPTAMLNLTNPLLLTNNLTISSTSDATLSGIISGPGRLAKSNAGPLTLSGANTYSGGTLLTGTAFIHLNNTTSTPTSSSIGTGPLTINGPVALVNTANVGTTTLSTNNPQIWGSDFSFFGGTIGITPAHSLDMGSGPVTLTASRILDVGGNDAIAGDPKFTVGGAISDGGSGFGLTKENFGTLILTSASTYSGGTTIRRGAINTATIGNTGSPGLGTGSITLGTSADFATLRYTGPGETTNKLITLAGSGILQINQAGTGLLKLTSDFALTGALPKSLVLSSFGATAEMAGKITGANINLSIDGQGTWILSGDNTFTTRVTINSGTLSVSSLNSVVGGSPTSNLGAPTTVADGTIDFGGPFSPGVSFHTASTLRYTGPGETTDRVINLKTSTGGTIEQAGTGLLKFTSNIAGRLDLSFSGSTTGRGEFAGLIDDIRGVTKFGSGTWTLSANNTYTGVTRIFGGQLLINGNQSAATGESIVNGGSAPNQQGVLGGIGTIGGPVSILGGIITAAGMGDIGTLRLNSSATFIGNISGGGDGAIGPDDEITTNLATYAVDIAGPASDQLLIRDALNLSDALDQITFTGSADGTTTYLLASYSSHTGTFDFATPPPGYQLIYGPTQLTLAPVPEPNLIALGLSVLLFARRISRRSV